MKRELVWTADARRDLQGITVASRLRFGARQAAITASRLRQTCGRLLDTPHLGRARAELHPQLRSFPLAPHIIFYVSTSQVIRIIRILHGGRDMPAELFDRALDES